MTNSQKKTQEKYDERYPVLSIRIDRETYNRLQGYSNVSGRPVKDIVSNSLKDYLNNIDGLVQKLTESIESTNIGKLKQFFGANQDFNSFMNELDSIADSINKIRLLFNRK